MRDLLKFQIKLLVDGIRDLVLSPVSLVAALIGLVSDAERPDRLFRRTLVFGRRTERWINLFGQYRSGSEVGIDDLMTRLERRLVEQYRKGGMTADAKNAVDRCLGRLHRLVDGARPGVGDESASVDKDRG